MPKRVRLKIKHSCFFQFSELTPSHGVGCVRYGRRIEEKRDGTLILPDERKHVAIDGNVAVINSDHDRTGRRSPSFSKIMVNELSERDHSIAIVPEIFQMGFEEGCGYGHDVVRHSTKTKIREDGVVEGS